MKKLMAMGLMACLAGALAGKQAAAERFFEQTMARARAEQARIEAQRELQEREDRRRWAIIVTQGAAVSPRAREVYGCRTLEAFGQMMAFILYGEGRQPPLGQCWILEPGMRVVLANPSLPNCDASRSACEFRREGLAGRFQAAFFTTVHALQP
jgi:hypothetical protein